MSLRYRQMRPPDVRGCVELVAAHPAIAQRYGDQIAHLHTAWLRLLEREAKVAVVFEELHGPRVRLLGIGVSVFVDDEFMRKLKRPPFFWIGPELAKRIARQDWPLLSDSQLRSANSDAGLNLVVWEGCICPDDLKRADVYNKVIGAFMDQHRGYLWKEIIGAQPETVEHLRGMLRSGNMLWDPASGRWHDSVADKHEEIVGTPHVIGLARDSELRRPGSWIGSLFDYVPPRISFAASEQRLLLVALAGRTDEELSNELSISLSRVKKTWRAIYDRVSSCLPGLIPDNSQAKWRWQDRGKEKKQRLIAYLRDHPEELRPVSRKILRPSEKHR